METFSTNILLDLLILCGVSLAIAIPLYQYIRNLYPDITWHTQGNITTSPYMPIDLLGILLASSIFILSIINLNQKSQVGTPSLQELSSSQIFLSGLIGQLIPVAVTFGFLMPRVRIAEIFHLDKPDIKRVLITSVAGLFAIYIIAGIVMFAITPFLESNLGKRDLQAPVQMIMDAKENNPALLIYLIILATIVAPICEEFVFRGYIYGTLKRFSCRFFAATISSLFFAIVHANVWSTIPLFIVGLGLAIIYEISKSLWAPMLAHCLFNSLSILVILYAPAQP